MTGGEFFAQAHICPVCHDDHGGPDCTPPLRQYEDLPAVVRDYVASLQAEAHRIIADLEGDQP